MKNLKNLGKNLNKNEQKAINGGLINLLNDPTICRPEDVLGKRCSNGGTFFDNPSSGGDDIVGFTDPPADAINCLIADPNIVCSNGIFTIRS